MSKEEQVTIYYAVKEQSWEKENGTLTRWALIVEYIDPKTKYLTLAWIHTYNEKLTKLGITFAEFYRDGGYRLCIRAGR